MKSINYKNQEIIAVHRLTTYWEGAHIPNNKDVIYTLMDDQGNLTEINEMEFNYHVKGSGIPLFSGSMRRGGGRHGWIGGIDANEFEDKFKEICVSV